MKKLKRSSNRVFGGVLGGIADYFQTDPLWIRLAFLLFAFIVSFGTAFILYFIALLVMPRDDFGGDINTGDRRVIRERAVDRRNLTVIGLVLILVGLGFLAEQIYNIEIWWTIKRYYYEIKNYLWPILIIILGIWVIYRGRRD